MRHHPPSADERKAIVEKCRAKSYPQKRSTPRRKRRDLEVKPDTASILDAWLKHKDEA